MRLSEHEKTKPGTVTRYQREILHRLSQSNHISIGELATLLGVSSVAATKNVNRLERKRLVKRVFDEMDRRRALVSLTPAGLKVVHELSAQSVHVLASVFIEDRSKERPA